MQHNHTIAAVATGEGGAIAVIRVSGPEAVAACDRIFRGSGGRKLTGQKGYTLHYGTIVGPEGAVVDEVIVSLFRAPHSYTGEELVEIGCHASPYIRQEILRLLTDGGVAAAAPGEFTLRAFLNGKMDLAQAEAVADLIAADSRGAHDLAISQMRGGYSDEFRALRAGLIDLAALLELELDFGEEDVEFADRGQIRSLMDTLAAKIDALKNSYAWGNVIKNGIPVAIVGAPNVGKSTLLNALLREDRAMVSDIPGTTRDAIEDTVTIHGIQFRFIDTAGIRRTDDTLEAMGIERTFRHISSASVILFTAEATATADGILAQLKSVDRKPGQNIALVLNKIDKNPRWESLADELRAASSLPVIGLSARTGENRDALAEYLRGVAGKAPAGSAHIVTNARHYQALSEASDAIARARTALEGNLTGDLLAEDIRAVIHHIGTITAEGIITPDEVLQSVFGRFCIGK
jgi:tRNA modification GTPase